MTGPGESDDPKISPEKWPDPSAVYEREYTGRWADAAVAGLDLWLEGNAIKLAGSCPRCGHQLDDYFLIKESLARKIRNGDLVRVADEIDSALKPLHFEDVLVCNCESKHDGRPAERRGCGAFAGLKVELAREPPSGERAYQLRLRARRAILRDRAWDEAAERAELDRLAQVQSHAEKQSGFFTALLGLLSAALIVQGTEQILAKPLGTRQWIAGLFAAGIAAGAVAILLVARAARGGTRSQEQVTGPAFYAHSTREIEKAVRYLKWAALPATLALSCLTAAAVLVWLVEPGE